MWNAERGYGFIADDAGGPDMFRLRFGLEIEST